MVVAVAAGVTIQRIKMALSSGRWTNTRSFAVGVYVWRYAAFKQLNST